MNIVDIRMRIQEQLPGQHITSIFPITKTDKGETVYGMNGRKGRLQGIALVKDESIEVIL